MRCLTVTRRVSQVEQELVTHQEHMITPRFLEWGLCCSQTEIMCEYSTKLSIYYVCLIKELGISQKCINPTYKHISVDKEYIFANHKAFTCMSSMNIPINQENYDLLYIGHQNFTRIHIDKGIFSVILLVQQKRN